MARPAASLGGRGTPWVNASDAGSLLSGGELQRLALARALCRGADILVLDEPTSALDAENEALLYRVMEECRDGRIVILCSHRRSAEKIADRVLRIVNGRITSEASSKASNG